MRPIAGTRLSALRATISLVVVLHTSAVACSGDAQSGMPPIADIRRVLKDTQMIPIREGEVTSRVVSPETHEAEQVTLSVLGFLIDRTPVSCADYEACVLGRRCAPHATPSGCTANVAVATFQNAIQYCFLWRKARLLDWNEWQLAVRGPDNDLFPNGATWMAERGCLHPAAPADAVRPRCEHVSKAGVSYATRNSSFGEWVVEATFHHSDLVEGGDVAVDLQGQRLDQITTSFREAEFRCARGLHDR